MASVNFEDFYEVPNLNFDIAKLKEDLDNVVFMQPTSPLRSKKDLDNAIVEFSKHDCDTLFSAVDLHPCLWVQKKTGVTKPINYNPFKRKRRQVGDVSIVENGSFYIFDKNKFIKNKNRLFGKIGFYLMNKIKSFQIDDLNDFEIVKSIMNNKKITKNLNKFT